MVSVTVNVSSDQLQSGSHHIIDSINQTNFTVMDDYENKTNTNSKSRAVTANWNGQQGISSWAPCGVNHPLLLSNTPNWRVENAPPPWSSDYFAPPPDLSGDPKAPPLMSSDVHSDNQSLRQEIMSMYVSNAPSIVEQLKYGKVSGSQRSLVSQTSSVVLYFASVAFKNWHISY